MVKNEIGRWKCHVFEFLPCIGFKKKDILYSTTSLPGGGGRGEVGGS